MKRIRQSALTGLATFLVMLTSLELSAASVWWFHQPKVPNKKN